jgi:hypothetical protein
MQDNKVHYMQDKNARSSGTRYRLVSGFAALVLSTDAGMHRFVCDTACLPGSGVAVSK